MTMWGKFARRQALGRFLIERIPTPDDDELTILRAERGGTGPIMLLLHGLEGGAHSHYVAGLWEAALSIGWQPTMLLFRTCDGRLNRARRTYHSGETTDLDLVVRRFASQESERPICIVGVSLGGNVLLKWLGEHGVKVPESVRGAVAISTPYDLARCSRAIGSGFSRIYQWNFLRSLKAKAHRKLSQHPDVCSADTVHGVTTMWEFDDVFTAPLHGFQSAGDYYERSSSLHYLDRIRRPALLLSAFDDPFHTHDVLRDVERVAATNPFIQVEFHRHGGHVGFVSGTPWRPAYYLERRVASFLEETVHPKTDAR